MNSKLIFHLGTVALFLGCASLAAQNNTPTISKTIALNKAKELAIQGKWGMVPEDMQMAQIQDLVIDRSGDAHAYVLQTVNGIPVVNGVMGLHFRPNGSLYYTTNRAVPHVAEHVKGDFAQLNTSALGEVALKLAFTAPSEIPTNVIWESMKTGTQFEEGKYYEQTVAWPNASGDLIPAKYYVFFNAKTSDWVNVWISEDGSLLQRHSWTVSCAPSHFHNHKSGTGVNNASSALTQSGGGKTLNRRGDGATYKAYAYPTESPLYGNPSNLSSPAMPKHRPMVGTM